MAPGRRLLGAALLALAAARPARAEPAAGLGHRLFVSPDEIRATDSRTLAERLVERIHLECDEAGAPPAGEAALGSGFDLVMMVPAATVGAVARRGFLNQHQTLTTNGFDRLASRFETEQELAMTRLPYSERGRELLPKYGVLNVKKPEFGAFVLPERYGSVAIVFKPEVARRATWTYADSLDFSQRAGRFGRGGASNPVLARTASYRRKIADSNRCGNYCEAQIWGELSLKDADYAMIRDTEPVPAALVRAGLPVYRYSPAASSMTLVAPGQTAQFVRGARVSAGAAARDERETPAASPAPSAEFARRLRRVGDLAAGRKDRAAARELNEALASSDAAIRAQALYGLSELPWGEFKPLLIGGLKDPDWQVEVEAVAFAAEHRGDREVAEALDGLRRDVARRLADPRDLHAADVQEWLARLDKTRLCE